jgi:hypothetical protein
LHLNFQKWLGQINQLGKQFVDDKHCELELQVILCLTILRASLLDIYWVSCASLETDLQPKPVVKGFTIPQMGFFPYDPVVVAMLFWERTNKYKTTTKQ